MFRRVLIGLAAVFAATPGTADICSDLTTLQSLAESKFSRVRGSFDPEYDEYKTDHWLPGVDHCYIELDDEFDEADYTCVWKVSSRSEAMSAYERMVADIERCTGAAKRSRTAPSTSRTRGHGAHSFDLSEDDRREIGISTHVSESLRRGHFRIFFTMDYEGAY